MSLENKSENIPEDVKDLDIKIRFEDIDAPQDDKIWSVYSDGLDGFELNQYYLTFCQAINMCISAHKASEGYKFTLVVSKEANKEKQERI